MCLCVGFWRGYALCNRPREDPDRHVRPAMASAGRLKGELSRMGTSCNFSGLRHFAKALLCPMVSSAALGLCIGLHAGQRTKNLWSTFKTPGLHPEHQTSASSMCSFCAGGLFRSLHDVCSFIIARHSSPACCTRCSNDQSTEPADGQ